MEGGGGAVGVARRSQDSQRGHALPPRWEAPVPCGTLAADGGQRDHGMKYVVAPLAEVSPLHKVQAPPIAGEGRDLVRIPDFDGRHPRRLHYPPLRFL